MSSSHEDSSLGATLICIGTRLKMLRGKDIGKAHVFLKPLESRMIVFCVHIRISCTMNHHHPIQHFVFVQCPSKESPWVHSHTKISSTQLACLLQLHTTLTTLLRPCLCPWFQALARVDLLSGRIEYLCIWCVLSTRIGADYMLSIDIFARHCTRPYAKAMHHLGYHY